MENIVDNIEKNILNKFTEKFRDELNNSPLNTVVVESLLSGISPFRIIEDLLIMIDNQQQSLSSFGIRQIPKYVVVTEKTFAELKNQTKNG